MADKEGAESAAAVALTSCSNSFAEAKIAEWWDYAFSLFARFGRYTITSNETEQGETLQRYPAWWLKSSEVAFMSWSPKGRLPGTDAGPTQPQFPDLPFSMNMLAALLAVAVVAIAAVAHQWGIRRGVQQATCLDEYRYLHDNYAYLHA